MIKFIIDENIKDEILNKYKAFEIETKGIYELKRYKIYDSSLIIYFSSHKPTYTLTIQGSMEPLFKEEYKDFYCEVKKKAKEVINDYFSIDPQIGSDEVGFGDFFGPLVVASAYCDIETLKIIKKYGIDDSKKLTDNKILEIIPSIVPYIHSSYLIVDNVKLNELFSKGYNMNKIKSILHNQVLYNLSIKIDKNVKFFIDEFVNEKKYYSYLENQKNVIKNITFETKGEQKYPSIALASCIARYVFLQKMKELSLKYKMNIPFGANYKVTEFAKKFILKYSKEELDKIVKKKFINYKELS